MKESKMLKISWIILTIGIAVQVILSVVGIIHPLFTKDAFESFVGESWGEFAAQQPKHAALYQHFSRMSGCLTLIICVCALFIIFAGYRKGEKWAWMVLVVATTLGWGTLIVFASMFSDPAGLKRGIVNLCGGLVVLLLPVKEIWGANTVQAR